MSIHSAAGGSQAYTIVYFDASAIVKRYVAESGSEEIRSLLSEAIVAGTSLISRVEVAAALAKAERMRVLPRKEAALVLEDFYADWNRFNRLQVTEFITVRAASLAWEYGLRAYDALHLASALFWQEMLGEPIRLVTYDRELWQVARELRMEVFPLKLS